MTERTAFTITEFCERNCISTPLYYKLKAVGQGPVEMRLGATVRISVDAERAWQRAREAPPTRGEAEAQEARAALLRERASTGGLATAAKA